jgi:hypothetical protein
MSVSGTNGTGLSAETSLEDDIEGFTGLGGNPLQCLAGCGSGDRWRKRSIDVDFDDFFATGEAEKDKRATANDESVIPSHDAAS